MLEWSAHPREALDTLIDLNNRYAVDGRDPNSYSGSMWCFYMSSDNTARMMRVKGSIERHAGTAQARIF